LARDIRKMFQAEATLMKGLQHENVVRMFGYCSNPDAIVMEYMPKNSLWHVIQKEDDIPWSTRWKYLLDASSGMYYLHTMKVIHGDLKPQNMLIAANDVLKLSDFGMSKVRQSSASQTNSGVLLAGFTPAFAGPELLETGEAGNATDVFAFAITMWNLWTRETPWRGMGDPVICIKRGDRPPINQECPFPQYLSLMQECWDKDPGKRPRFEQITSLIQDELAKLS